MKHVSYFNNAHLHQPTLLLSSFPVNLFIILRLYFPRISSSASRTFAAYLVLAPRQQHSLLRIRHFSSLNEVKNTIAEAFMTAPLPDPSGKKDGMEGVTGSTPSGQLRMGKVGKAGRRIQCWGHRGASGTFLNLSIHSRGERLFHERL